MKTHLFAPIFLAASLSLPALSQDIAKTENPIWEPCPQLPYLPEIDSVARQATVDSVAAATVGRWELVEIGSGWGPNYKPERRTAMMLSRDGAGTIYEDNQWSATFRLALKRRYNSIWFTISEPGNPFFDFRLRPNRYGLFRACDEKLIIGDARAHGKAFAFRRVPTTQPQTK